MHDDRTVVLIHSRRVAVGVENIGMGAPAKIKAHAASRDGARHALLLMSRCLKGARRIRVIRYPGLEEICALVVCKYIRQAADMVFIRVGGEDGVYCALAKRQNGAEFTKHPSVGAAVNEHRDACR